MKHTENLYRQDAQSYEWYNLSFVPTKRGIECITTPLGKSCKKTLKMKLSIMFKCWAVKLQNA